MEGKLYSPLPKDVQRQAKSIGLDPGIKKDFIQSFLQRTVSTVGKIKKAEEEIHQLKYRTQQLDNFKKRRRTTFDTTPAKRNTLTARERRDLKVFQLDKKDSYRYTDYLPMNSLWLEYIQDLIGPQSTKQRSVAQVTPKLLKADYHGCLLTVVKSKCPSYVGSVGIVVQETRNTFKMVTRDNRLKVIPKANSVFMFDFEGFSFKIYGNQFRVTASDRVRKRFKLKATVDL